MTSELNGIQPVVMGTPVDFGAGLKVIQPNMSGTDAVPLIDGQTAGILQAVNSFKIKQRVRWGEALTQGCIEQSNVYDIYDATNGNHVFVAVERSEGCVRRRCAHPRPRPRPALLPAAATAAAAAISP